MTVPLIGLTVAGCLVGAVLLGLRCGRFLREHHRSAESKDAVKVAMGLVATMSALLLGLLVSAAKDAHDTAQDEVVHLAAKIMLVDRVLQVYGPEADPLRAQFQVGVQEFIPKLWSSNRSGIAPDIHQGHALYAAIERLSPRDETQRMLKTKAADLAMEIAQLRALLCAQSGASISHPLLVAMVFWLVVVFFSFGLFAPNNAVATVSLMIAAVSVAVAVFLILELDGPFSGLLQVSSEPLRNAMQQLAKGGQ